MAGISSLSGINIISVAYQHRIVAAWQPYQRRLSASVKLKKRKSAWY